MCPTQEISHISPVVQSPTVDKAQKNNLECCVIQSPVLHYTVTHNRIKLVESQLVHTFPYLSLQCLKASKRMDRVTFGTLGTNAASTFPLPPI